MDAKGLLERAEEAIANDGKNVFYEDDEVQELLRYYGPMGVLMDTMDKKLTTLCGRPLVKIPGGYKLFIKCEWCGTHTFPNRLGWCSQCNGWV